MTRRGSLRSASAATPRLWIPARPLWAVGLAAGALALPVGCGVVDLGTVTLAAWQPEALASGDEVDLVAEAEELELEVVRQDGSATTVLDGTRAEGLEAAPEGEDVRLILRARGDFGVAVGRSELVHLEPDAAPGTTVVALAPPGATHALASEFPDARSEAAVCAAAGLVWVVGGQNQGALAFGSWRLDAAARAVVEGPGLPTRRRGAQCAPGFDDDLWLFGGCDEAGAPEGFLQRAAGQAAGASFASTSGGIPGAGCGAAMARGPAHLWLVWDDQVQLLDTSGERLDDVTLPEPRFAPQAVATAEGLFLAGGQDAASGGADHDDGLFVSLDGNVTARPEIGAGTLLTALDDGRVAAFLGDRVAVIGPTGVGEELVSSADVDLGTATGASALAPLYGGRFALLSEAGDRLLDVGPGGTRSVPVSPARPGAALAPLVGGAVAVLGGGERGALVYVSADE